MTQILSQRLKNVLEKYIFINFEGLRNRYFLKIIVKNKEFCPVDNFSFTGIDFKNCFYLNLCQIMLKLLVEHMHSIKNAVSGLSAQHNTAIWIYIVALISYIRQYLLSSMNLFLKSWYFRYAV